MAFRLSKISVLPANRVNDGINRSGDSTTVHMYVLDVFITKKHEGHFCNQIFKVLIFDKAGTQ